MHSTAPNRVLNEVPEVALKHPHPLVLLVGTNLGGQEAVVRLVRLQEVGLPEGRVGIPSVDDVLALVPEEDGGAQVGSQDHQLLGLGSHVHYRTLDGACTEVVCTDAEDSGRKKGLG